MPCPHNPALETLPPSANMTIRPAGKASGQPALTGLTVQDQRRIQEALDSSTSAKTRRAYNQAWRRFEAWAADRGHSHPLPASPVMVAAFLAELAEAGKSVATLRLAKSALAAVHRSTGHQDPTDNEGVKKVMASIARVNGRSQHPRNCLVVNWKSVESRPQRSEGSIIDVLRDNYLSRHCSRKSHLHRPER